MNVPPSCLNILNVQTIKSEKFAYIFLSVISIENEINAQDYITKRKFVLKTVLLTVLLPQPRSLLLLLD